MDRAFQWKWIQGRCLSHGQEHSAEAVPGAVLEPSQVRLSTYVFGRGTPSGRGYEGVGLL